MNIKDIWSKLTSPICNFLEWGFFQLSKVDGKPGLSADDFLKIVGKCIEWSHAGAAITGSAKANAVAGWIEKAFSGRVAGWVIHTLVWIAYQWGKRKGRLE